MFGRVIKGFIMRTGTLAKDDRGIGVVELILILVVLISLVIIFKSQLTNLVNKIFKTINNKATSV